MSGPKETAYDQRIAPLMTQIIALCHEHKINMAATFALDPNHSEECYDGCDCEEPIYCTTVLGVDESDKPGHQRILACRTVMCPPNPYFAAFTITTGVKP